jgi:ABC-type transport system substrate-binding protein
MYDAQHTETNMDKRIEMWRELQRYMAETVPCIYPYASPPRYEIVNDRVKNYSILSNNSRVLIRQAWLDK